MQDIRLLLSTCCSPKDVQIFQLKEEFARKHASCYGSGGMKETKLLEERRLEARRNF